MKMRSYVRVLLLSVVMLVSSVAAVTFSATQASADPDCVNGGVYVLFARGSGEHFDDKRAEAFKWVNFQVNQFGRRSAWAELGNLDGDYDIPGALDFGEYPATPVTDWHALPPFYGNSVETGARELVRHLNDRAVRCPDEVTVLGGYSQGADVIGWALQWQGYGGLSATARRHIAYVALYGDPRFDCGPWDKTNVCADHTVYGGTLGARNPYAPEDIIGRFGSWCDIGDGICTARTAIYLGDGNHGSIYQNELIGGSARHIAIRAILWSNQQGLSTIDFNFKQQLELELIDDFYFHGIPPNGAVVENYDGGKHKYVAVGGSLVYIPESDDIWGYVHQMQRLHPSGQFHDILRMRNDEIHALEFNWGGEGAHRPANNSFFYERGNPTQYIMQYGLAFPIASVDELSYLGGIDRAIMVPAGAMGSVKASAGRLPSPPNGTILHTLTQSDPDYEYQPDKLYWANNYTVQECIRVVKGAGHQRIPQSMANFFAAAGRYHGNKSACDFGYNRVLYGPKDNGSPGMERWYMYGNNTPTHPYKRYQYASPFALQCRQGQAPTEVIISRQGLNEAPVGEQLQCPDNSAVRNQQNGEVFWVIGGVLHLVPSYDTLACLTKGIPGNPTDMAESLLSTVPRAGNASCSFENKLLRGPDGKVYWVKGGQRHYVGNPLIQNCIAVRAGAGTAWNMPQSTLDHITPGEGAHCPYPDSINFVRGDGQSQVWLVYPDGTRRHALSLCAGTDPRFVVHLVPAGEVDGHRYVGDWSATATNCAAVY